MKLKMDKALIRAQKIILGKGEKAAIILAEPQVLRQWDDVAKKVCRYRHRYKYTFTFDGAEKMF